MTQYFYNQNDEQKGPISLDELKNLIISEEVKSDTFIWSEGFEDWIKAFEVSELKGLFITPPPLKKERISQANQAEKIEPATLQKKKRGRFLVWLIPLLIIGGISIAYFNQQEQQESEKRYERVSPSRHLRVDNVDNKVNLLLDDVIKGTISNTAESTTYGEIVLELTWYDKKDKVVSRSNYTINEIVRPYGSTNFKIKDVSPFKARKYHVEVKGAKVINQY